MADSPEIPLHVFQVLEEEYISLHGPISADGLTVELPDEENENKWRPVEARLIRLAAMCQFFTLRRLGIIDVCGILYVLPKGYSTALTVTPRSGKMSIETVNKIDSEAP